MKTKQILSILTIITTLLTLGYWNKGSDEESIRIGIIQTTSHPAEHNSNIQVVAADQALSDIGTVDLENKYILMNHNTQKILGIELPLSLQSQIFNINIVGNFPCH